VILKGIRVVGRGDNEAMVFNFAFVRQCFDASKRVLVTYTIDLSVNIVLAATDCLRDEPEHSNTDYKAKDDANHASYRQRLLL